MRVLSFTLFSFIFLACLSNTQKNNKKESSVSPQSKPINMNTQTTEKATFAGGCFWCTEAIFLELKGVISVMPGYIGGTVKNPTYEEVCQGTTGHAEAIEIVYNPSLISYEELLEVFFATHDPTTLNRQGADVGTQYRSEVFYHTPQQQAIANEFITLLNSEKIFDKPVVTRVSKASVFYEAEDYHQNYYNRNTSQGYCMAVINPKLEKFRKSFKAKLK